jgi:two-component system, chemotaxis family, chemotaxis protein CheY
MNTMAKRILVIDDSESMRVLVTLILESAGYKVQQAIDGADALNVLDGRDFNLILTDLNMPNMDGISLIAHVRTLDRYKAIPIIMLTTESLTLFKERARSVGATGWIVKPFVGDELLSVIKKVMR